MVNKFGDNAEQGPAGPPGEQGPPGKNGKNGKNAFDLIKWFPTRTVEWFREIEDCCYYFKDKKYFIKKDGNIVGLKSHSRNENDAINLTPQYKMVGIPLPKGGYCLEFKSQLFKVKGIELAIERLTYATLIITFKLDVIPVGQQYIVSDDISNRAVTVNGLNLQIWGTANDQPFEFKYKRGEWHTLFVQWTYMGNNLGYVYFGREHGTFFTKTKVVETGGLYIGGKKNKSLPFVGCIAALEVYESFEPKEQVFPEVFRNLLIADHESRV